MVDGRWNSVVGSVSDLLDGTAQNLARSGFGQPLNDTSELERGDRADPLAYHLDDFRDDLVVRTPHACFEHDQPQWNFSLDGVGYSQNSTFSHVGMRGQHLFHGASGQTMPGDIDDVIRAAHDPQVTF